MAGYPSLSHSATYRVQPRLPSVHLCFWYSPWFNNVEYFQFEQVPLRLWSIPLCCFCETFMKGDLTWEYSKSQTFVPGWGETFGSRWCPGSFSGGRVLCAGGWSQTCQGHLGCARLQRMKEIRVLQMLLRLSKSWRSHHVAGLCPCPALGRQY